MKPRDYILTAISAFSLIGLCLTTRAQKRPKSSWPRRLPFLG